MLKCRQKYNIISKSNKLSICSRIEIKSLVPPSGRNTDVIQVQCFQVKFNSSELTVGRVGAASAPMLTEKFDIPKTTMEVVSFQFSFPWSVLQDVSLTLNLSSLMHIRAPQRGLYPNRCRGLCLFINSLHLSVFKISCCSAHKKRLIFAGMALQPVIEKKYPWAGV